MAFSSEYDDDEVMSEINMTPLVDVMLVLLIIFMLTVPILTQSVDIELPQTSGELVEQPAEAVTLAVNAGGQVFWNAEQLNEETLAIRLNDAAGQSPQPPIHIHGDQASRYEHVAKVMARAQEAGLTKLGFVIEVE